MGVPKFYRWISERYPCLSEIVKEYQIPEFDNLYLDMNGIIHLCSHPNDDDPHFRITEEDIFKDIFHYIEVLFRLIQPKKIFYMAVDGVAPRAKMNQQRGRRFRSAREAEENEKKAREKGEVLPTEARFDSNCITPGTEFMTKLDAQLQYFVSMKVTTDKLWHDCSVIYSGHKTPGEGEHKIMEYIRFSKSQPDYDSNTRHCLYGLDADLIMLGLTSHEPHFSLLREEVRFGLKKGKTARRTPTPEETTFHLLHLSLMREYIEYEFSELKETIPFPFDIEGVIDDWVLMGFLVGNDFIPNLPGLHINKDALPLLYDMYKAVLPTLDGYLNEGGYLQLGRFEKFMAKLTEFDVENFHELNDNVKYMKGKQVGAAEELEAVNKRMTELKKFDFEDDLLAEDAFGCLEDEGKERGLTTDEVRATFARLDIQPLDDFLDDDDEGDESGSLAGDDDEDGLFREEFRQHKRHYYMTKLMYEEVTPQVLRDQATNYVRGLQWILHYYYNGISSWSWYYPHHYAPYISDVKDFVGIDLSFEMGTPFLPFEQLLAVLPPLSAKLLPQAYQKLMLAEDSPLKEFYPKEFSTDLNGKQQDWEAVVLIPFINEKLLLEVMSLCNDNLLPDEKERNSHGPMFVYSYTPENLGECKAPAYFPSLGVNRAKVKLVWRKDWDIAPSQIIKGLLPGARKDLYFAGFPTLKHVEHTFHKENANVRVFQQDSRGENFVLDIIPKTVDLLDLLKNVLGKVVFVAWPHLVEAKVVSICSKKSRFYVKDGDDSPPSHEELDQKQIKYWQIQKDDLQSRYLKRWGVNIGDTEFIVYARQMSGRSYVAGHDGLMTLEKIWSDLDQPFPLQVVVRDITTSDPGFKQYKTVQEYFTPGSKVFMLGNPYYGCMGEVMEIDPEHKGRIRVSMVVPVDPNLESKIEMWQFSSERYASAATCATRLSISAQLFARLTGSVFMAKALELNPFMDRDTATNKLNIGLNLKSNKRSEEVVGFTRRCTDSKVWLYSEQCIKSLEEYQRNFPEIFEFLHRNPSKNDIFQDEVFPSNYTERVPELTKWLKEAPFTSAERCQWGTEFLDPSVVEEILKEIERKENQTAKAVRMQVRPHLLFKPNPLQGSTPPDPKVTFRLFDRVSNVREGFSVPLGLTGTIIGIQPAAKKCDRLYVILFDEVFAGGLTLAGPASAMRCYRLSWSTLINISHGRRIHNSSSQGQTTSVPPLMSQGTDQGNRKMESKPHYAMRENRFGNHREAQAEALSSTMTNPSSRDSEGTPFTILSSPAVPCGSRETKKTLPHDTGQRGDTIPQPPNPNQLPKPLQITESASENQFQEDNNVALQRNAPTQPNWSMNNYDQTSPVQLVSSEDDVKVIIHGNFYERWPSIRQHGLQRDRRIYIPCVSYVPPKLVGAASSRSYEIHIYLNVGKLLKDGIRILLLQKGQVLCSTNKSGFISPEYFEKVVDTNTGRTIFPFSKSGGGAGEQFSNPPFQANNWNEFQLQNDQRKGRGRGTHPSYQSQPLQLYENIWSQMQQNIGPVPNQMPLADMGHSPNKIRNEPLTLGKDGSFFSKVGNEPSLLGNIGSVSNPMGNNDPPYNNPLPGKVVSVDELFKMASADQLNKTPPRFTSENHQTQTHYGSGNAKPFTQMPIFQSPTKQCSLAASSSFSQFHPLAHLNAMTSPRSHFEHESQDRMNFLSHGRNHHQQHSPQKKYFHPTSVPPPPKLNHAKNQNQNHYKPAQSQDSQYKSPFVPTQVARKQTPRKVYPEDRSSEAHSPKEAPQTHPEVPKSTVAAPNSNLIDLRENTPGSQPKRKPRSRIAANLGFSEPVKHDNG